MPRFTLLFLLSSACTVGADGNFTGYATYRDAAMHDGQATEPAPVEREDGHDQPVTFEGTFAGIGSFGNLADICISADSSFSGSSSSRGSMDAGGDFVGEVDAGASGSTLLSGLGCVIEDLDIEEITSITVRATIEADTENCTNYCEANARAECEGEGDSSVEAQCETDTDASCYSECTSVRHAIVAETTIDGGAELDAVNEGLEGDSFGSFSSDLSFSSME
jgi:hypothetical protein